MGGGGEGEEWHTGLAIGGKDMRSKNKLGNWGLYAVLSEGMG